MPPPFPPDHGHIMRNIFIGDVHGCSAEFRNLLNAVSYRAGSDRLLLTGDAFARGPDPLGVWEILQETGAEMVMGNHDAKLLEKLQCRLTGQPVLINKPDQQDTLDRLAPVSELVLEWLTRLPLYILEEAFLLVHAGINPAKGFEGTIRDEFLAIRTWPAVKGITGPRWHDALTPDHRTIIFGHDAPNGLVVKRRGDGSTYLMGLDSGCVYGGLLSAYILEDDRIVQVKSKDVYF